MNTKDKKTVLWSIVRDRMSRDCHAKIEESPCMCVTKFKQPVNRANITSVLFLVI